MNSEQTINLLPWSLPTRYDLSYTIHTLACIYRIKMREIVRF